ncbi:hypothetical protein Y032_0102g3474 [Ancylostoma ceylanicum]|uniref:Uncharacterized protein n=1 Tax=Ancylostoma ceylanicum TaxID=53326 RepID=A0A016TGN0_9BILA|nr:hypothetical protein Y032_0102g3474 [Ancylostoma ceylanicum]
MYRMAQDMTSGRKPLSVDKSRRDWSPDKRHPAVGRVKLVGQIHCGLTIRFSVQPGTRNMIGRALARVFSCIGLTHPGSDEGDDAGTSATKLIAVTTLYVAQNTVQQQSTTIPRFKGGQTWEN